MTNDGPQGGDRAHPLNKSTITAMERAVRASEQLRSELEAHEGVGRALLELMATGLTLPEAFAAVEVSPSELREKASGPLDCYLESRRDLRMALIEACLALGFSRGQIGDMMGVSRQRITALAKDLGVHVLDEQVSGRVSA